MVWLCIKAYVVILELSYLYAYYIDVIVSYYLHVQYIIDTRMT